MKTKQAIAVIGASGKMGSTLAKSLSKGNYRILLQSSQQNKVELLADNIRNDNASADIAIAESATEACWEADIIIAAVPYTAEKEVAEDMRQVANQKIVVSVSNPFNNSFQSLITTPDTSAAEELQNLLPHTKVVKAFNTTSVSQFYHPVINGQQIDCFIAGNDEEALQTVYDLVKTTGFNPVIAGDLSVSRTLEKHKIETGNIEGLKIIAG